ncbi:MAG: DUF4124 domain-containing protein [Nevskiales bacterium]|nr:DUF4124 domain-containing protein [Nevskiales bacterium]
MRLALIVLVAGFGCAAAPASEVYRWVQEGEVYYGDRPKQEAELLEVKPGSGPGEPPEEVQARAEKMAECERLKEQLASYKRAPGLKEVNALGGERVMSPEEHRKLIALTEKKVTEACAPPAAASP